MNAFARILLLFLFLVFVVCLLVWFAMDIYRLYLNFFSKDASEVTWTSFPSKNKKKPVVYLTLDDVPWKNSTSLPQVCDLLQKYEACATLFVLGLHILELPKFGDTVLLLQKWCGTLLSLQNHGFLDYPHWKLNEENLRLQLEECENACETRGLKLGQWYRPGSGLVTPEIHKVAKEKKLKIVLGDVYTFDAQLKSPLLHFWCLKNKIRDGSVVILHDRPYTIPLLQLLLPYLKSKNFEFRLLPEPIPPEVK